MPPSGHVAFAAPEGWALGDPHTMTMTVQRHIGTTAAAPGQAVAIASVIFAMMVVAIGNGLMFAYIPVRLGASGFAPAWAGSILTGLSAGGIAACLTTAWLVRRVGHARAYMVFSAIIALSNCGVGAGVHPVLWIAARALYGFAICGMFIVAQSWLNDAIGNSVRGRVMAIFYVAYVIGLGIGYYLLGLVDIDGPEVVLICVAFTAVSILPVGLTRLAQPPAPLAASIGLRRAWRISPVGVAGMMAAGGLSMTITGFAPIHATAKGYSQQDVATLLSLMPFGTILLQLPFGWISDRTDRRYVLVAASVLVTAAALLAMGLDGAVLIWLIPIYMMWGGASESVYSLASAHANDRASKEDLVTVASAMLFAWSISGFVVPALVTLLTAVYGTQAFMVVGVGIAAFYSVFVVWRIARAQAVPKDATGTFSPMTAQAPLPADLAMDDGPGGS